MHLYLLKKASPSRRLFFCLRAGLVLLTALGRAGLVYADCPVDRIDQIARVSYVADGDTVKLDSGQWLRLIGVNTPEKGRDGQPDEPLALSARDRLQQLLAGQHMQISLRLGSEPHDRHGRLLAHAFLADGSNLSERLLADGLGFHITVPPNVWGLDCYRAAEQGARQSQQGVWKESWYYPRDSRSLPKNAQGFMRIRGKVIRLGQSKRAQWINLEGKVALRLDHRDKPAFSHINLGTLVGKTITVRGWFYPVHNELRTNLRHPTSLETN
jgi:endonuclease YncB( thermonuclease family)